MELGVWTVEAILLAVSRPLSSMCRGGRRGYGAICLAIDPPLSLCHASNEVLGCN